MLSSHFHKADLYGEGFRTVDLLIPEPTEQEAMTGQEAEAPSPKGQKHGHIWTWLGIIVLFVVLFQVVGRGKT